MADPLELTVTVDGRHLTVRCPPDAPTTEVADAIAHAAALSGPPQLAGRPLAGPGLWRTSGVRHGSVLDSPAPAASAAWELRVIAGPAAGSVLPIAAAVTLGRDPGCDLVLDDREVSRRHAEVSVDSAGLLTVRDLGSTNGLAVDGVPVGDHAVPLAPGARVTVGESLVVALPRRADPAALVRGPGAALLFNRPPRARPPERPAVIIEAPAPPAAAERGKIPLVTVLVPVALGAVLFLTMPSSPQYLLLMAMSPLMVVGNLVSERRGGRRRHRRAVRDHAGAVLELQQAITDAVAAEEEARRAAAPDPAELLGRATLPSTRLWERRGGDPDGLLLRVGLADLTSDITVRPAIGPPEPSPVVRQVPVTVSLDEVGVLGLAGARGPTLGLTRWLVGQAATLMTPGDLTVVLLTQPTTLDQWQWLRWLPHARSAATDPTCRVLVGADDQSQAARVADLVQLVASRQSGRRSGVPYDRVLVVLDGARDLRQIPGLAGVLSDGPAVGVLAVCRDDQERLLPQECSSVAVFDAGSASRLTLRHSSTIEDVLADQVSCAWAETLARGLAGLDDASRTGAAGTELPVALALLDLVGLGRPTAAAVADHWRDCGASTRAVLGAGADGPLWVDLSADGPHALVAGTTGSGKSELLQTLVASLAIANRPDALNFVLIDYKGGAAFRDCARLPHTVGLVTDLDGRLTERALASLTAELRHRERVLAEHAAKDIEALWSRAAGPPPLARLVIVIDEFATLVEELPDFVRGLVGIAQRGRSLGIHLVLATQRPGGVVSPDIRANTNLRICLRVTQTAESADVIDAPDAGEILAGLPGRGFLRTGAGALQAFQAARVGGASGPSGVSAATSVEELPFAALIRPLARAAETAVGDVVTDLSRLVDAVCAAHLAGGLPAPRRPWLDPLPELLTVASVPASDADLPLGLVDLPTLQQRRPYGLRLADAGHLLVVGAQRSGRSAVLQTLAGGVATSWSADDLHLYGLDFGNQALAPLAGLPHCGAIVHRDQPERLERLLVRLLAEVQSRQALLAADGFADLAEQRLMAPPAERLPWMLLLVDRWEGLVQAYQDVDMGRRIEDLLTLLREGPAVGLRAVVTADRSGLLGRLPSVMPDKLVLRLSERADYALADIPLREVPSAPPPGRGLVVGAGEHRTLHEVQIALLTSDPAGPAQLAALRSLVEAAATRHASRVLTPWCAPQPTPPRAFVSAAPSAPPLLPPAGGPPSALPLSRLPASGLPVPGPPSSGLPSSGLPPAGLPRPRLPLRVDALPPSISVQDVLALGPVADEAAGLWALIGVGGDHLRPVGVDLAEDGPGFLVVGAARSGRSTALLTMARSLLRSGRPVCIVSTARSPLHTLVSHAGVTGCLDADSDDDAVLRALASDGPRPVVIVDDAERLTDTPVGAALEAELRAGPGRGAHVLAAGNSEDLQGTYRGFTLELRRSRCGLLLNPQSTLDGDLVGARLPRHLSGSRHPGRALLAVRGELTPVQVAQG